MTHSAKRQLAAAMVSLLAVAGQPCLASTLAEVKARGKLEMLTFPHQESPFIRVDVDRGLDHFDGIDHDVMAGFARSLGVTLEVHPVKPSFAALIPALLSRQGDVIASSYSITPERQAKVAFSDPYFAVRIVVVVRRASAIRGLADLAGKTGATVKGSSQEERMRQSKVRIHYVEFTRWNYDALMEQKADFTMVDETSAWRLLPLYPDLKVAFALDGVDRYGYAVRPGSDLKASLDLYLGELKKSGKLEEIVRRYLGREARSGVTEPPAPAAR